MNIEQKIFYYNQTKRNIPFRELHHTIVTVCELVKPIYPNTKPLKYFEYFFTEIDFDKIDSNPSKAETLKYCNAIYYGLEQLLKADISKAIHNYQNNISNLTKQQIQETQIQIIELIGNLKRQARSNEAGISFTHRYNLLYKNIEAKETFHNIDYQIFIAHFNETISNDLLSSFEIINETFKEIAPLIQDKATNTQPKKEQKIEAPVIKLFCALVHQSKLMIKDIDESPEKFITRVINKYSIKNANPKRARQYFDAEIDITKKDQKEYLREVHKYILPNIETLAKQQIETYLQSKNLYG